MDPAHTEIRGMLEELLPSQNAEGQEALRGPHFPVAQRLELILVKGVADSDLFPFNSDLAFIGSDEDCDLQLIDPSIPSVHSTIRSTKNGIWIEAVAHAPLLTLNEQPVKHGWIREGDLVQIGPFQFRAQMGLKARAPSGPKLANLHVGTVWSIQSKQLDEARSLSAEELLDRIVDEQQMVSQHEAGRRQGMNSLWKAVKARARALQVPARAGDSQATPTGPRVTIRLQRTEEESVETQAEPFSATGHAEWNDVAQELEAMLQRIRGLSASMPTSETTENPPMESLLKVSSNLEELTQHLVGLTRRSDVNVASANSRAIA